MDTETKRERFKRITEARTNKIIDMINLLGNCSNKNNYEYKTEDIKKIFSAIETELKIVKNKFIERSNKKNKFYLD